MRRLAPLLFLLLIGCSRVTVNGEVRADGSMKRTLTFGGSGPEMPMGGSDEKPASTWEDTFALPSGAGWQTKRTKDAMFDDPVYIATRVVSAGTPFEGDFVTKSEDGKKMLSNSGKIVRRPDGTFEYTETLKWLGKRPDLKVTDPKMRAKIKAALPEGTDTATIDKVTMTAGLSIMHSLFGPGDPVLDSLLSHREYAFRRLGIAVRKGVRPLVADEATAERVAIAALKPEKKEQAGPPTDFPGLTDDAKENTKGGPCSALYLVKFPGEVLETNGKREEDGTIVWRFYTEAASIEDITLRAVFRP